MSNAIRPIGELYSGILVYGVKFLMLIMAWQSHHSAECAKPIIRAMRRYFTSVMFSGFIERLAYKTSRVKPPTKKAEPRKRLRPDDVPARHVAARPDGLAGGGQSLTGRPSAITSRSRWRLVARRKKRDLAPMPGRKMVWIRSRTRDRRDRRRQNTGGKCKWAQPNQGTTAKAKGRRGGFSNFDGLVQQRIESALRCAPANSILW